MQIELNDLIKTKIDDKKMQVLLETLREIQKANQIEKVIEPFIANIPAKKKKKKVLFKNLFKKRT